MSSSSIRRILTKATVFDRKDEIAISGVAGRLEVFFKLNLLNSIEPKNT